MSVYFVPLAALGAFLGAGLIGSLLADLKFYLGSRKSNPAHRLSNGNGEICGASGAGKVGGQ